MRGNAPLLFKAEAVQDPVLKGHGNQIEGKERTIGHRRTKKGDAILEGQRPIGYDSVYNLKRQDHGRYPTSRENPRIGEVNLKRGIEK